ncbi:MAG: 5-oxoprolinase subunit PxpB [Acidobacteriota bacterium]|nr:5-oxoprolinase subunit PxpB [Acidobacteriota bacterium]
MDKPRIFPLGESAATVDFGNQISAETNDRVLSLANYFDKNPFAGFVESIVAYSSLTIFYDVFKVRENNRDFETAFAFVSDEIEKALLEINENEPTEARLIEIPVCFDAEFAPDLDFIAAEKQLSPEEVIEIFLAETYRVFMLGFLPGFAYLGEVAETIVAPRKQSPRLQVPAGSVGIAGRQTGIYSLASPGGWQIIGRTPLEMFNPKSEPPTYLQAGDAVRFYQIDNAFFAEFSQKQSQIQNSK